ncbi:Ig-like domain-containing protein [Bradyrhizobium sp. CB1717]|uniref:Ig-like domain-containing protein n=1 Tax=Bradyrhizobium sp. CB1717 TaxID=3039154 RepID=UPI0024B205DD|nr:Ig-like domain-containing protein [Bradyrhizobium sp. CB1717]WFU21156.1 Ig-like domain-containing protein [Bradyrhizobium sp. CB1717]
MSTLDGMSQGLNGLVSYKERDTALKLAPNAVLSASGNFGGQTLATSDVTSGVNDGDGRKKNGHDADIALAAIKAPGVNHAPVIDLNGIAAGTSATLHYNVGDALTALAPVATVVDVDSANFGGGSLHVAITQNGIRSDQLAIVTDSIVSLTGSGGKTHVKINGVPIGVVSGGENGNELVISFIGSATSDRVQILLDHIGYSNSSKIPSTPTREISFKLIDGDGIQHGGNDTGNAVAYVIFDSAPPDTAAASGAGGEDASVAIALSGSDADGTVSSFRIINVPANGVLYRDALLTALLQPGDSVPAINNSALVYFRPAPNWNGSTDFNYASVDNSGAQDATPATASITIHPVNDAPTITSVTLVTIGEDAGASPVGFSAPTDVDGDALTITVTSLPAKGTVYLADGITAVVNGQTLTSSQLTGLLFTPADNANGDAGLFSYTVSDGIAAPVAGSVAFTITPQNDAPVVASATLTIAEDAPAAPLGLSAPTDADGDALTITVTSLPAKGTVYLADGITAVVNGQMLTSSQLTGLLFTPAANANGDAGLFSYTVSDGIAAPVAGSVGISITPEVGGEVTTPIIYRIEDDTGLAGDGLTSDRTLTLSGTATPGNFIIVFLDGQEIGTTTVGASGEWIFDYSAASLSDGSYSFSAEARLGTSTSDRSDGFAVEIDTIAPALTSSELARSSDTGAAGDLITEAAKVTIVGQAEAGATVALVGTSLKTVANINGGFSLPGIDLPLGTSELTLRVVDAAGNENHASLTLERIAASGAENAALAWNQTTLDTIRADGATPIVASRTLAMESIAVLDVLAAIDGTPAIMVGLTAPANLSVDAAVAAAAHRVLAYLYPGQAAALDQKLAADLADIPEGDDKAAGLSFGRAVADAVIALRDHDGWDAFVTYNAEGAPGQWVPTPPMFDVPLGPQWGSLTPFALQTGDQFRPGAPPSLDSAEYAAAFDEVMRLGSATSSERTAEQTQIARFWADGLGSFTPSGHWNAIATEAAQAEGLSLSDSARMLAMLNIGLADAGIAAWDAKYFYGSWRPITAIRRADEDGNPETTADPTWQPLLLTPAFPEYISGHSTYSATAATILSGVFGDYAFSTTSIGLPGVTRSFDSFDDAAAEAGQSRIYGGIHFQFANIAGQATGRLIGDWVLDAFSVEADTRAPVVLVDQSGGLVTAGALTLTGFALDNLAGLASLEVQLDNGPTKSISVDEVGRFSFDVSTSFTGITDGQHALIFTAKDTAGNTGDHAFIFIRDTAAPTITLTSFADGADVDAATRLVGAVDGTGSTIASLSYQVGNGPIRPIVYDHATGAFDELLELGTAALGANELRLFARDAAGHTQTLALSVNLPSQIPFAIDQLLPSDGADDIGVTFRPQVTFTRAADAATLNANTFFATDASGAKIPANIVVSPDGLRAWLFFDDPLPGSSTVKLNLDGDAIRAVGDGAFLDGDTDGIDGGDLLTSFTTVSRTPLPNTTITGVVVGPGADLKPMTYDDFRAGLDGAAHTSDDLFLEPIANAKVYILGFEDQAVFTDAQGRFALTNVPGGVVKVAVDGRTATNAPVGVFYPEMVMDVSVRPGQVNTLMGTMGSTQEQIENLSRPEVYLPRLSTGILQTLSDTTPTVITAGADAGLNLTEAQREELQITVQPGIALDENGRPVANAQVGIQMVDPALVRDMLPPGIMQLAATFTIQAPGVAAFATPVKMSFPNLYSLAPGEKTFFYSFNHTTGLLEISGTATVSADGFSVVTDPGQGILAPGWYGVTPPGNQARLPLDENGPELPSNDPNLPEGVKINPAMRPVPNLDGVKDDLLNPETLLKIRDAFRHVFGDDADLLINSGKRDGTGGSQHNHGEALDFQIPPGTTNEQRSELIRELREALPNGWRIGFSQELVNLVTGTPILGADGRPIGVPLPSANFFDPPPGHIHIDNGNNGVPVGTRPSSNANQLEISNLSLDQGLAEASSRFSFSDNYFTIKSLTDGNLIRGAISPGSGNIFLASNQAYLLETFDADSGYVLKLEIPARQSGQSIDVANFLLPRSVPAISQDDGISGEDADSEIALDFYLFKPTIDTDHDGLPDAAEEVIGSLVTSADSDGDGVSDLAEIKAKTNPLDGVPVTTGVIAATSVQGEVRQVTIESSVGVGGSSATAYVATGTHGLAVVDVTDAFKPVVRAELDLPGTAVDLAVDTSLKIAAIAAGAGGLHLVDVSDSVAPTLIKTVAVGATTVDIIDGIAYVNDGGKLRSFDLATGDEIQTLDLFAAATTVTGLAHEGSFLYVLDNSNIVHAVEVVNGLLMVERGSFPLALGLGSVDRQLFVAEGVLHVPAGASYATINVANPAAMSLISGPDANNIVGTALALNGSGLGIAVGSIAGNAIDIVRTDDPANTGDFVTRITLPTAPTSVAIGNGLAFVGAGNQLQVVNYLAFDTQGQAPTVTLANFPADIDPTRPGIQVQEGQVVPFGVRIADDVQVRDVELLVNGQVQRVDGAYPFDLRAVLPTIAANDGTSVTLQAHARDTGGNAGLSDLLTIELVPDTIRPQLMDTNLVDGATVGSSFRTLRFNFSEPLDPATVSADNFHLFGPDGVEIVPTAVQLKNGGFTVQLSYAPLALGEHRVEVDLAEISDRAGNTVAASVLTKSFNVAKFSIEWIAATGGNANNPANWSENRIPNASDDAFIDLPVGQIVTFNSIGTEFGSLTVTAATLQQTSGTLTISNGLKSSGAVGLTSGTLVLNGNSNSVGSLSQLGGTFSGIGSIALAGATSLSGGVQAGTGTTVAQGGAAFGSFFALDGGRVLQLGGSSTATGTFAQVDLNGANPTTGLSEIGSGTLMIATGATFDDQTTSSGLSIIASNFGTTDDGSTAAVNNEGTLIKSGAAATSRISAAFSNRGVVEVQNGTLVLLGGGTDAGAIYQGVGMVEFAGGTRTLDAASSITGNATFSGGTTTINGIYTGSGGTTVSGVGTVTFAGAATTGSLVQTGGLLAGSGTLTATGPSAFSGGTQGGAGTTLAQGGAAFSNFFALDGGRVLQLGGSSTAAGTFVLVDLNGANPITGQNDAGFGTMTIAAGATFDDQTTSSGLSIIASNFGTTDDGSTAAVNNEGTFIKSGSAATSRISAGFNNRGVVEVQSGTLVLSGGGTDVAAIYQGAGTTEFTGGIRTLDAASSITGNATFSGGTTTVNGSYTGSETTTVSGGTVMFAGAMTTGSLVQTGGLLAGGGTVTASGTSAFSGGTQGGTGTILAQGGALLSNFFALDAGRVLQLGGSSAATGTFVLVELNGVNPNTGQSEAGSGTLAIASGATFEDQTTNSGLSIVANNFGSGDDGLTAAVNNFGTLIKSGSAGSSRISVAFNNHGLVEVQNGTLVLSGGGIDVGAIYQGAGTIEFAGGIRTLDAASSITGNATFSGGTTTIDGSYTGSGTTTVSGVATVEFAGGATTGALVQTGGILTGGGTLTASGTSAFSNGAQAGTGTTLAQGGAAFSSFFALDGGRALQLGGSSAAIGAFVLVELNGVNPITGQSDAGSGTLTIANGATFDDQTTSSGLSIVTNNFSSGDDGSTAAVNNLGTFIKSGSGVISTISAAFNNSGVVEVQNGTLRLSGGGTDVGAIYQGAGTIEFAGGIRTLDAASSITGNATFSGGTTIVNGSYTGSGTTTASGGTVTFAGAATTGTLVQTGGLLAGSGTVTAIGPSAFSGGTQGGTGATFAQGGASLSNFFALDAGRELQLGGSSAATGTFVLVELNGANPNTGQSDAGSGVLTIANGATFDDQTTSSGLSIVANNFSSGDDGSTAAVNNLGTFIKSGSAATSTISVDFINQGLLVGESGLLRFSGDVDNSGGVIQTQGGNLEFTTLAGGTVDVNDSTVHVLGHAHDVVIDFSSNEAGTIKFEADARSTATGVEFWAATGLTLEGLGVGDQLIVPEVSPSGPDVVGNEYVPNATGTGGTLYLTYAIPASGAGGAIAFNLEIGVLGNYTADSFVFADQGNHTVITIDPATVSAGQQSTELQSAFAPSNEASVENSSIGTVSGSDVFETAGFSFKADTAFSGLPAETISESGAFTLETIAPSDSIAVPASASEMLFGSTNDPVQFDTSISAIDFISAGNISTGLDQEQLKNSTVLQSGDWTI